VIKYWVLDMARTDNNMSEYTIMLESKDNKFREEIPLRPKGNGSVSLIGAPILQYPLDEIYNARLAQVATNWLKNNDQHSVGYAGSTDEHNISIIKNDKQIDRPMAYRIAVLTVKNTLTSKEDQVPVAVDQDYNVTLWDAAYATIEESNDISVREALNNDLSDALKDMAKLKSNHGQKGCLNMRLHLPINIGEREMQLTSFVKKVRSDYSDSLSDQQMINMIKGQCRKQQIDIPAKTVDTNTELKELLQIPSRQLEHAVGELLTHEFSPPQDLKDLPDIDAPKITNSFRRAM
jgi:hypothetical protein